MKNWNMDDTSLMVWVSINSMILGYGLWVMSGTGAALRAICCF